MSNPLQPRRSILGRVNPQTGTAYMLAWTDHGALVTLNNAAAITVTVPLGLGKGFFCQLLQIGAGPVTITPAAGVTINAYGSATKTSGQHAGAVLSSYGDNLYNLGGNVST